PGFEIVVVTDAVAAIDKARGDELLAEWTRRGVQVATTDEVLAEVRGRQGGRGRGVPRRTWGCPARDAPSPDRPGRPGRP
ncbi:MAG: hypothetical protein ACRDYV_02670, partial [Acidimicrobiia bacterium]